MLAIINTKKVTKTMSAHVRVNESKINAADKLTVTKLNELSKHIKFRLLRLLYGTFFPFIPFHLDHAQLLGNIFVYLNVVALTKNQLMYNDRCSVVASDQSKCEINIYTSIGNNRFDTHTGELVCACACACASVH